MQMEPFAHSLHFPGSPERRAAFSTETVLKSDEKMIGCLRTSALDPDPDPDLDPDPRRLTDAATERKVAVNKLITHVVLVRINRSTAPELLSITSDVKLATGAKLVMKQSTLQSHPGAARFFFKPPLARMRLRPIITTLMNRSVF